MFILRKVAYEQRAQRYLKLYSSIKTTSEAERELIHWTALQRVVNDKLKRLVEDPRTTYFIAKEIKRTQEDLQEINGKIQSLLVKEKTDSTKTLPTLDDYKQKLAEAKSLVNEIKRDKEGSVPAATIKIKEQQLEAAFFHLREILDELKKDRQKSSLNLFHTALKTKAEAENAQSDYLYSRAGKLMGIQYTISQIVIMTFLGVLLFSSFGTGAWVLGLVIPLMILGIPAVGRSNWWLFRGLVAQTLIILRNMFRTPTDVPLTRWEKFKLTIVAVICCVSGFLAAYAFYILIDSLFVSLLQLLGTAAFFTAAAAASPWLVPLLLGVIVLPIFIGSAIAVATYFFRAAYEPTLRGKSWQDMRAFFSALFTYGGDVAKKLAKLKTDARAHYGQYYQGAELDEKVKKVVDESTIGTILNKNLTRDNRAITIRAWVTSISVLILIPGMIGGIIATQLLSHANLSDALYWVNNFANSLSWAICAIAGIAYTPVLVNGGAKCVVDLAFGVEKKDEDEEDVKKKTKVYEVISLKKFECKWIPGWNSLLRFIEKMDENIKKNETALKKFEFQWVRGWNSFLNFLEGVAGYIMKKADKITHFSAEAHQVFRSSFDLTLGTYLTVAAGAGSFLTNSIQGKRTRYEENRNEKSEESTKAAIELQTVRQHEEAVAEEASVLATFLPSWKGTTKTTILTDATLSSKLAACKF